MSKRRRRNLPAVVTKAPVPVTVGPYMDAGSWLTVFDTTRDPSTAFQRDVHHGQHDAHRNWTVFSCQTLIAGDMGKMSPLLMKPTETEDGVILKRAESPSFSPLFRRPNGFQTWPQFMQWWMLSKLHGNAYALKEYDNRHVVTAMYVLDPHKVRPLVTPGGDVYYRLLADDLAGVPDGEEIIVPAEDILHDRMNCLFHPLVGLSPLHASGLAASQGLTILEKSRMFFENNSRPGGILSTEQMLDEKQAKIYADRWKSQYGGSFAGGTAVLGNGLKYNPIAQTAVETDLVKQLGMTAEMICSTYHVPGWKIGVGARPSFQNAELEDQSYYDTCIQVHMTDIENLFDAGLGLYKAGYCFKFDLDDLLKMDSATLIKGMNEGVGGGWMKPNEARVKRNLAPVAGGNTPYLQVQNYALAALAKRDAREDPFAKADAAPTAAPPAPAANDDNAEEEAAAAAKELADYFTKGLEYATA